MTFFCNQATQCLWIVLENDVVGTSRAQIKTHLLDTGAKLIQYTGVSKASNQISFATGGGMNPMSL